MHPFGNEGIPATDMGYAAAVADIVDRFSTGAVSINDALVTALLPGLSFGGVRSSRFGGGEDPEGPGKNQDGREELGTSAPKKRVTEAV